MAVGLQHLTTGGPSTTTVNVLAGLRPIRKFYTPAADRPSVYFARRQPTLSHASTSTALWRIEEGFQRPKLNVQNQD